MDDGRVKQVEKEGSTGRSVHVYHCLSVALCLLIQFHFRLLSDSSGELFSTTLYQLLTFCLRYKHYLGYFSVVSVQLADQLVSRSIVDTSSPVGRRRQQELTSEVKADIEHFILMTGQSAETPALVPQHTRRDRSECRDTGLITTTFYPVFYIILDSGTKYYTQNVQCKIVH